MKEEEVYVTVIDRVSELELDYSKADVEQIELMGKKYFRNKLNYDVRTDELDFFGGKRLLATYKEKHLAILDKAIFKFYENKSKGIYHHLRKKPKDIVYTIKKHKICVNNMVRMIYANPRLKRNRFQLWMRKKFLTPKLLSGDSLGYINTRKDPMEKHLLDY